MLYRKITAKHYLNKRAKPRIFNGQKYYPLYIQLIAAGQRAQLKSKIPDHVECYRALIEKCYIDKIRSGYVTDGYFTEEMIDEIKEKDVFPLNELFNDEIDIIRNIITSSKPFTSSSFSLTNFSSLYSLHLMDIYNITEDTVKKNYLAELKRIFNETAKSEMNRRKFKLCNYFIHYINWHTNFCEFYENTYEVLPSEIKYIENYLNDEVKLQIKALMAFHSRNNVIKRHMEKSEKGLFPNITFTDWQDGGKSFLSREFVKLFGQQKARDYIVSIDKLLNSRFMNV